MEKIFLKDAFDTNQLIELASSVSECHPYHGNPHSSGTVSGLCNPCEEGYDCLVYIQDYSDEKARRLQNCFILVDNEPDKAINGNVFCRVKDPKAVYLDMLHLIRDYTTIIPHSRDFFDSASVSAESDIADSVFIEPGVRVKAGVVVEHGCVLKTGTMIGSGTVIRANTTIGANDASVYRSLDGRFMKFPHYAGVIIENNVDIGSGTVICRGTLNSTVIRSNCTVGNQCSIGCGATIDSRVWISAGCLIRGHTSIGWHAHLDMGVLVDENLSIGRYASVAMGDVVRKSIAPDHALSVHPARERS